MSSLHVAALNVCCNRADEALSCFKVHTLDKISLFVDASSFMFQHNLLLT